MSYPSEAEVANRIRKLYESPFGGKNRGRFKIADELMRRLAGRPGRMEDGTLKKIQAEAHTHGLELSKKDGFYTVIEIEKMLAWRPVPARLVRELTAGDQE